MTPNKTISKYKEVGVTAPGFPEDTRFIKDYNPPKSGSVASTQAPTNTPTQSNRETVKIEIRKADDCDGFAAYMVGTMSEKKPVILLNVYATLGACIENNISIKEQIIESLMHEFGHVLQEFYELEFSEEFVEGIVESYREKYGGEGTLEENVKEMYTSPPTEPMTTKVEPTVEGWDTSAKPDQTVVMITNSIFNAIGWEKHYTVKERQALNDVVDEIVSHSVQEAKADGARQARDWMVLAGVTIDGVDYINLDDALDRFDKYLSTLTTKESIKQEEDK